MTKPEWTASADVRELFLLLFASMRISCLILCLSTTLVPAALAADPIENRQQSWLDSVAKLELKQGPIESNWVDEVRWSIAHARLARGVRLDEANQYLSEVVFCSLSHGLVMDTDVQVTDLIRTYFEFRDSDRLSGPAKAHLKDMLADWKAPNPDRNRKADSQYEWPHEYTENHSLNILVAAYLIDAALDRDRAPHRALLEQFLGDRAAMGWNEFNSPQYGLVTAKALVLLSDFAPDESVRLAAKMQLDLLIIHYSAHCLGYWRGIPASRGSGNQVDNRLNAFLPLARLWFGDPAPDADYSGAGFIVHFLTSKYRPPAVALDLQRDQVRRGHYVATQVATSGPAKLRVPIVIWVSPYVTMASAQGSGSYYDGSYVSISFASHPDRVITSSYDKQRTVFQHQNVVATFGSVDWHGEFERQTEENTTTASDGKTFVGAIDLGEDCHLIMVGDATEHPDLVAFRTAFAALGPKFENGVVSWTMPDGKKIEMLNQIDRGKWSFVRATLDGKPVRIDNNMLFDSPYMRSVRGSGLVEVLHGDDKWVYDLRDRARPTLTHSRNEELTPVPPDTITDPLGLELLYIPPGEFVMGSPLSEGRSNERPQRWVTLDGFYISKTEITVGQYKEFLKAAPGTAPPPDWFWKEWGKTDQYPMSWVTWDEATAFCRWLSAKTGFTYRLPTEAEWEKAAKGYSHRAYPWGDSYDGTQSGSPNMTYLPVGSKPVDVSPFGVMDMAGNVWEWCADWFDDRAYDSPVSANPGGPVDGTTRVVRSCGWNYDPDTFRASRRSSFDPEQRSVHIGFRVVRELTRKP